MPRRSPFVFFGTCVCLVAWAIATDAAFAGSSPENIASATARRPVVQKTYHDSRQSAGWTKSSAASDPGYKTDLPDEFDARRDFVSCASVIGDVKDQGNCASSWAVAVASSFTDRLCIKTDGKFTEQLSAQNLMSCGGGGDQSGGCAGGSAFKAWEFTMTKGIVTGGDFDSKKGCQPYRISGCDHHYDTGKTKCSHPLQSRTTRAACEEKCSNEAYGISYNDDLHKTSVVYLTSWTNVTQIQQEIATYGPVTAFMYVYENFLDYASGVYKSTGGDLVGYQYVKLIGWGVDEDDNEYWLAMNSWNSGWGDGGLFKILRGRNFCSIELLVMAGRVDDGSR